MRDLIVVNDGVKGGDCKRGHLIIVKSIESRAWMCTVVSSTALLALTRVSGCMLDLIVVGCWLAEVSLKVCLIVQSNRSVVVELQLTVRSVW